MVSDKTVLVAGGGSGIGRATAIELGRRGANVVVSDLGTDLTGEEAGDAAASETVDLIREHDGNAIAHFGDVASLEDTETLIEQAFDEYGRIDGAVNFAGIVRDSISWKMTEAEFDEVIRVHLRGHFSLFRNLASHWREQVRERDGRFEDQRSFLGVSSRSAFGSVGQLNYASAKSGIFGMMWTAARELVRFNIRVNTLVPTAHTRMTESIPEDKRPDRPGPENIAPVVAYLMSDSATDITGCTIRAMGDQVGLISEPTLERAGFMHDGWTVEDLENEFRETIASDWDLHRIGDSS